MKSKQLLIIILSLFLFAHKAFCCGGTNSLHYLTGNSTGTISCAGQTAYFPSFSKIWCVNTGVETPVQLTYTVDTRKNYDVFAIYSSDSTFSNLGSIGNFSTAVYHNFGGYYRGTVITTLPTGCFIILFSPNAGNGIDYPGIVVDFAPVEVNGGNLIVEGNVGIGKTPVSHRLEVDGTVRAKKIIVEPDEWSDFVFGKDYQLRTLSEVESHIEMQGHLPEIPSALEVDVTGVGLLEINAKLLQKIEELTLYIIEQEKRINKQSEEILFFKEKLDEFLQQIE